MPDNNKIVFRVGNAGKSELRRALVRSTDPAATIQSFQQSHSLHAMMPSEELETDSVMMFLHHLGMPQYDIHKRVSDTLMKQLEDEIRQASQPEALLELLKSSWAYATSLPELRPVVWAVLKKLGTQTPLPVLTALAERNTDGTLKHEELFGPLSPLLKRLVWEADWEARISQDDMDPKAFLDKVKGTMFFDSVDALMQEYVQNPQLVDAVHRPFVSSARERRIATTQRRALKTAKASSSSLLKTQVEENALTSGKAVSQLRNLLCDSGSTCRPKLLYAVLSILMAQHGTRTPAEWMGSLSCTLAADILLAMGGPLPKAYQQIAGLARMIDDAVLEGNLTNVALDKIQGALKDILEVEEAQQATKEREVHGNSLNRQLSMIVTAGLSAMKEADPQSLFLNPVTDAIAPGYSKVIKRPMCIVKMEEKVEEHEYSSPADWEKDVQLMFRNCVDYNRGPSGQWFRNEANRQLKVFRDEIFPQARRLYQAEVAKRVVTDDPLSRKRKANDGPDINPLAAGAKKRKKQEDYLPNIPALALMVLSDPFFIRIVVARALREVRKDVIGGSTLPSYHSVLPSLLQLLHMTRWSAQVCAIRGKRYFVPDVGLVDPGTEVDPIARTPFTSLRKQLPLLIRLLVEAELDKRIVLGGDLMEVAQSSPSLKPEPLTSEQWAPGVKDGQETFVALLEGSLVHLCLPGNTSESSLGVSFGKFAAALPLVSATFRDDAAFFSCLVASIVRHKAKLTKEGRDAIIEAWLRWFQPSKDSDHACCRAHEYLVKLLDEWAGMGNLVLPRDDLVKTSKEVVHAVSSDRFRSLWSNGSNEFAAVKEQYLNMLRHLPQNYADAWKHDLGLDDAEEITKNEAEGGAGQSQSDDVVEEGGNAVSAEPMVEASGDTNEEHDSH